MRFLLMILLALSGACRAAETGRPTGPNCELTAPHAEAGEALNHGHFYRLYPRRSQIPDDYTGCQHMWVPVPGGAWFQITTIWEDGEPVRLWAPDDAEAELGGCRYRDRKLVDGAPEGCPATLPVDFSTEPAGCFERQQRWSPGEPIPEGCEHD